MKLLNARCTRGQALVEFALVIPIFLLLVFGLVDLGRAVYATNAMSQAARDGARWGSVQARSANEAARDGVEAHTLDKMTAVPDVTVTVTCDNAQPIPDHLPYDCRINDILVVEVETEMQMITPIIGQIVGTLDLSATSRVVVNN